MITVKMTAKMVRFTRAAIEEQIRVLEKVVAGLPGEEVPVLEMDLSYYRMLLEAFAEDGDRVLTPTAPGVPEVWR